MPCGRRRDGVSAFPEPSMIDVGGRPPRKWRPFGILVGLIALPLVIIDQLSKMYVSNHMVLYESIPVIPNWFDITYTRNPGAAFSMFVNLPPAVRSLMLCALSIIACVVLVVLLARTEEITLTSFALALILAGAAGNLIDRGLRDGRVIDFIRVHYYDASYPIFNVADSAISVGVALVILANFLSKKETV
ncbi:MAG TPA: signal peptidase II [Candidatus Binataceae bacterium]|nr:signal peptidase II [Candidatus Binataceae bacterium]